MPPKRQIYLLDPQQLTPETIAVTFAKTSRSPQSFREIAAELSDEKSADFHEKWVVGYGHSSVAEHAVLHIAVENISRLAVETLESNRLASYTEKSSRYQIWSADKFVFPPELEGHPLKDIYLQTTQELFRAYERALPVLQQAHQKCCQQMPQESESGWQRRVRAECVDVCRYYLPAAALANVGMTINARNLEHAISKMLSHPLQEVQVIGAEIRCIAQAKVPTLVKHASPQPYLQQIGRKAEEINQQIKPPPPYDPAEWFRMVDHDPQAETKILAALLYRYGSGDYQDLLDQIEHSGELPKQLAKVLWANLNEHDTPLRELEHASLTIDVVLDQGAYGELKRHRMLTLSPQRFTPMYAFAMPALIRTAGLELDYQQAMRTAEEGYAAISTAFPEVGSYLLPNAFNRRALLSMNLRSAHHLIQLRTAPNAHFAMRRLACRLAEEIQKRYPLFAPYFISVNGEISQEIEEVYFTRT